MEYQVIVDKNLGIIRSTSIGEWTLAESDRVTRDITRISIKHNIRRVLIDHKKLKIDISRYLAFKRPAQLKLQIRDIPARVAFISPRRKHTLYQFFVLIAQNQGIQFNTFKREQDALNWLLEDDK